MLYGGMVVGWLVGWLDKLDWLIEFSWSADWLVGWVPCWLVNCLTSWLGYATCYLYQTPLNNIARRCDIRKQPAWKHPSLILFLFSNQHGVLKKKDYPLPEGEKVKQPSGNISPLPDLLLTSDASLYGTPFKIRKVCLALNKWNGEEGRGENDFIPGDDVYTHLSRKRV